MAKNDVVLLDGIIEQRLPDGLPSSDRGEVFEFFVLEEKLKDYDLSGEEIEFGWIDGRDDGGCDGFYIFVNGRLLEDVDSFAWPRTNASIEVYIFACKHHATFQQSPLDSLLATIHEVFDLGLERGDLKGSYSEELIQMRGLFNYAYKKLSIGHPKINFRVVYGSRGDVTSVGESIQARARQIEATISGLFSFSTVRFEFVGASELVESHRRAKTFSIDLPFLEHLATGRNSYVLLVRLEDYWKFVSDEKGHLRRYLFDSNVRDYLGEGRVNSDIAQSLADSGAPDFWWLNNGVTVLATNATVPGKTIQLQDIQIVNGLQTTETVFQHFSSGSSISRDRALLVKIIVSSDTQVRDRIIRATNNQNTVEVSALHATDRIQRDIEAILDKYEWYYERRKNYYRNIGKPQARFITPLYLASAAVALVLKNPARAARFKSKFLRSQDGYNAVFSDSVPIETWPVLAHVYRQIDGGLGTIASRRASGEKFISRWRALVSIIVVGKLLGAFSYTTEQLAALDLGGVTQDSIDSVWKLIEEVSGGRTQHSIPTSTVVTACCKTAAERFGIAGVEQIGRRDLPPLPVRQKKLRAVTPEFVKQVDGLLPVQPWKPGVHIDVASKIGCSSVMVSSAIQQLIAEGKRKAQIDGVVYGADGAVLTIDPDRVPFSIEELRGSTEDRKSE